MPCGPHQRGRTLDVRLEAHVGDELVWECDSVYLSRGRGDEDAPRGRRRRPPARTGPAVARWRLPEDLGRSYAGVSGDVNPIHLHALSAKAMGFPRQIAHGMWTCARTLAALGRTSLGPSSSSVWFTRPVFLPSTVELVVDRHDGAGHRAGCARPRTPPRPTWCSPSRADLPAAVQPAVRLLTCRYRTPWRCAMARSGHGAPAGPQVRFDFTSGVVVRGRVAMLDGRSAPRRSAPRGGTQRICRESPSCPKPQDPSRPDDVSTPHRASAFKAVGAVVAVAVVAARTRRGPPARARGLHDRAACRNHRHAQLRPGLAGHPDRRPRRGSRSTPLRGSRVRPRRWRPAADCGVNLGAAASQLLTLRGSTGGSFSPSLASYASGSLGVKEKKSGTSCYQVNAPSESLELGLGPGRCAPPSAPDAVATAAYLDVELKGSARILATARLGSTVVGTFELQSGSSIGKPPVADHATVRLQLVVRLRPRQRRERQLPVADQRPVVARRRRRRLLRHPDPQGARRARSRSRAAPTAPSPPAAPVPTPNASILEIAPTPSPAATPATRSPPTATPPQVSVHRLRQRRRRRAVQRGALRHRQRPEATPSSSSRSTSQTSAQFIWNLTWKAAPTAGSTRCRR